MKLYLLTQDVNNDYDTYDSAVVVAANEEEARNIHPSWGWGSGCWAKSPDQVKVEFIGTTKLKSGTVVCSSFNAG